MANKKLKCKYCGKVCKNERSLSMHERLCMMNPNRSKSNIETYNNLADKPKKASESENPVSPTRKASRKSSKYASYESAKAFAKTAKIESRRDYFSRYKEFRKQGVINLPSTPEKVYPEWTSWSDFLSRGKCENRFKVDGNKVNYPSYDEAKSIMYKYMVEHGLRLATYEQFYKEFTKTEEFSRDLFGKIPVAPHMYYRKHGGWKSWDDFLSVQAFDVMGYNEMRELFKENGIHNFDEMIEFIMAHPEYKISDDIESSCTIRGDWEGWDKLFGVGEENKETAHFDVNDEDLIKGGKNAKYDYSVVMRVEKPNEPEFLFEKASELIEQLKDAIDAIKELNANLSKTR